jgi:peptidyl-prolyl cis-trans isomerase SurA
VVRRKLRPQVDISESEIDLTLNQIASGSGKTQYHIAEIFLPVANAAEENDRRDAAENIVKKVNEGESFAAEAHQYSQAPGAAGGGDLGWVQEGQLDPELDRALEKMQPGQLSAPIRTNKGYHILLLRDIRHSGAASAENAPADEDQIISLKQIFIPVTKKDPENVVSAKFARGAALKGEINSCKRMSAKMKNFPSPGTTDLGKGKLSGLPQEMRAVVRNLKIGELSAPLHTPSGFAMIMVCSRQKLPAAGEQKDASSAKPGAGGKDEPSRDQIASKLGMARLDQMAERYLHDLRATAFIDKRI